MLSGDIGMLRCAEGQRCTGGWLACFIPDPHATEGQSIALFSPDVCICKKTWDLGRARHKEWFRHSTPLPGPGPHHCGAPRAASSIPTTDCPINPSTLRTEKMEMTSLLHGGLVALKLNSLSNAVMQEGTFMDSTRDNIIKMCYDINSNIS